MPPSTRVSKIIKPTASTEKDLVRLLTEDRSAAESRALLEAMLGTTQPQRVTEQDYLATAKSNPEGNTAGEIARLLASMTDATGRQTVVPELTDQAIRIRGDNPATDPTEMQLYVPGTGGSTTAKSNIWLAAENSARQKVIPNPNQVAAELSLHTQTLADADEQEAQYVATKLAPMQGQQAQLLQQLQSAMQMVQNTKGKTRAEYMAQAEALQGQLNAVGMKIELTSQQLKSSPEIAQLNAHRTVTAAKISDLEKRRDSQLQAERSASLVAAKAEAEKVAAPNKAAAAVLRAREVAKIKAELDAAAYPIKMQQKLTELDGILQLRSKYSNEEKDQDSRRKVENAYLTTMAEISAQMEMLPETQRAKLDEYMTKAEIAYGFDLRGMEAESAVKIRAHRAMKGIDAEMRKAALPDEIKAQLRLYADKIQERQAAEFSGLGQMKHDQDMADWELKFAASLTKLPEDLQNKAKLLKQKLEDAKDLTVFRAEVQKQYKPTDASKLAFRAASMSQDAMMKSDRLTASLGNDKVAKLLEQGLGVSWGDAVLAAGKVTPELEETRKAAEYFANSGTPMTPANIVHLPAEHKRFAGMIALQQQQTDQGKRVMDDYLTRLELIPQHPAVYAELNPSATGRDGPVDMVYSGLQAAYAAAPAADKPRIAADIQKWQNARLARSPVVAQAIEETTLELVKQVMIDGNNMASIQQQLLNSIPPNTPVEVAQQYKAIIAGLETADWTSTMGLINSLTEVGMQADSAFTGQGVADMLKQRDRIIDTSSAVLSQLFRVVNATSESTFTRAGYDLQKLIPGSVDAAKRKGVLEALGLTRFLHSGLATPGVIGGM